MQKTRTVFPLSLSFLFIFHMWDQQGSLRFQANTSQAVPVVIALVMVFLTETVSTQTSQTVSELVLGDTRLERSASLTLTLPNCLYAEAALLSEVASLDGSVTFFGLVRALAEVTRPLFLRNKAVARTPMITSTASNLPICPDDGHLSVELLRTCCPAVLATRHVLVAYKWTEVMRPKFV